MAYSKQLLNKLMKYRIIDSITNCWLWVGSKDSSGYGKICHLYKFYQPHRVIMNAESFDQVNHKSICKNRHCFNPEHLYIGTQQENVIDCLNRGTYRNRYITKFESPKIVTLAGEV